MASLGHLAVGLAIGRAYSRRDATAKEVAKAAGVFAALAMLPDADVVAFGLGVPYEHPLGHRGASHSIAFALLCTAVAWLVSKPLGLQRGATALATLAAVGTHPLLDTLTTGGLGCALLWPFSAERFFAPVRPIPVAPIGLGMLTARGLWVAAVELVLFSPLLVYALSPRRWRVPAAVVAAVVVGAAGLAYRSLRGSGRPAAPPSWIVTATRDGAGVELLETEVAVPIEKALGKVERMRTRIAGGIVTIEVWGPEPRGLPRGAAVARASDPYWLVRGARPPGAECGPEEPLPHVRIDPLKLAAHQIGALDVDRAIRPLPPEALRKLLLNDQVRLEDVATVEAAVPPSRCSVEGVDGPAWLVRAPQLEGATRLVSRIELAAQKLPELTTLKPAAITREPPLRTTLWFSEPYDAARARAELSGFTRSLDGMKRVRLVLRGAELEQLHRIALAVEPSLAKAPLVLLPLGSQQRLDVKADAEKAQRLGIALEDVEQLTALALRGRVHDGVRVTIDLAEREHLGALFIGTRRLNEVVTISRTLEPVELLRENGQRAVELVAYGLEKRDVPMPTLPPGVSIELYDER